MPKPSPNITANSSLIEVISKLVNLTYDQNRQKYIYNTEDLKKDVMKNLMNRVFINNRINTSEYSNDSTDSE